VGDRRDPIDVAVAQAGDRVSRSTSWRSSLAGLRDDDATARDLVIATAVSMFAGESHGAELIVAIVAASVAIEVAQSRRARRTIDLMRARAAATATVRRDRRVRCASARLASRDPTRLARTRSVEVERPVHGSAP
jgi:hypothetical protein